jgi:hypothetical protein
MKNYLYQSMHLSSTNERKNIKVFSLSTIKKTFCLKITDNSSSFLPPFNYVVNENVLQKNLKDSIITLILYVYDNFL